MFIRIESKILALDNIEMFVEVFQCLQQQSGRASSDVRIRQHLANDLYHLYEEEDK